MSELSEAIAVVLRAVSQEGINLSVTMYPDRPAVASAIDYVPGEAISELRPRSPEATVEDATRNAESIMSKLGAIAPDGEAWTINAAAARMQDMTAGTISKFSLSERVGIKFDGGIIAGTVVAVANYIEGNWSYRVEPEHRERAKLAGWYEEHEIVAVPA